MSHFPVLKTISMVRKLFAVLSISGGIVAAFAEGDLPVRIGAVAGGLLSALILWAFAELISVVEEIGAGVRAKAQDDFAAVGLTLKSFYIGSLKPSEKSAEELRAMGMLDMQTYTQLQAADALREAAQNPSGGAGLTAGLGAGVGLGGVISQSLQGMAGGAQPAGSAAQPTAPTSMTPGMTPSEAAQFLKVSEEDVIAAITSGDLKAKKIGSAYRISKEALEEFLKG